MSKVLRKMNCLGSMVVQMMGQQSGDACDDRRNGEMTGLSGTNTFHTMASGGNFIVATA